MSAQSASHPASADVDVAAVLKSADDLRPLLESHAAAQETSGQLSEEVIAAFQQARLFGFSAPRAVGGLELGPRDSLELVERLAYADAAASWVLFAMATTIGDAGAFLSDEAVAEMFADGQIPLTAGQGTRPGKAVPDGDGYKLTGQWGFGSGIKHADWVHSGCLVEGTNEFRITIVPKSSVELRDNWDVMGLRATGSIDYSMKDVAVRPGFSHLGATVEPLRGGPEYTIGLIGIACIGHTGWAIGVGRRLLDELRGLVEGRAGRPGTLVDSDAFHIGFAGAEVKLRAAKALAHETWSGIEETVANGDPLSTRQHTELRLALAHATISAHEVGNFVYEWAGTTALRSGTIQRFFRDLHAGTQHITSGPSVQAACGRDLVGLADGSFWAFLALIDPSKN